MTAGIYACHPRTIFKKLYTAAGHNFETKTICTASRAQCRKNYVPGSGHDFEKKNLMSGSRADTIRKNYITGSHAGTILKKKNYMYGSGARF